MTDRRLATLRAALAFLQLPLSSWLSVEVV